MMGKTIEHIAANVMLPYLLAIVVASGSVGLYIGAFFFPEIHRKTDFLWSGVGCFYALFLWLYASRLTGGLVVGTTTSVVLIGWLAWQVVKLRRDSVPADRQTPLPTFLRQPKSPMPTTIPSPATEPVSQGKTIDPAEEDEAWIRIDFK